MQKSVDPLFPFGRIAVGMQDSIHFDALAIEPEINDVRESPDKRPLELIANGWICGRVMLDRFKGILNAQYEFTSETAALTLVPAGGRIHVDFSSR
jgi:hypothetical protein